MCSLDSGYDVGRVPTLRTLPAMWRAQPQDVLSTEDQYMTHLEQCSCHSLHSHPDTQLNLNRSQQRWQILQSNKNNHDNRAVRSLIFARMCEHEFMDILEKKWPCYRQKWFELSQWKYGMKPSCTDSHMKKQLVTVIKWQIMYLPIAYICVVESSVPVWA